MTRRYRRKQIGSYLFVLPYAASFACFVILPFVVAMVLSFLQCELTSQEAVQFVGLRNFSDALHDAYFWKAVRATFSFVVLMVPLMLTVSMLLALGLYAMGRGRNVIRALLFLPGMLNVAVAAILWQWFFTDTFGLFNFLLRELGLENGVPWITNRLMAMPSIVLMSLWWSIGGSTIIMLAGLQQIPSQLYEAAAIDGANRWQTFRAITLPVLQPVLLFLTIINTIGAFQVFAQPFLITNGGPELATRGVVQYIYETAFQNYRLGYGAAVSWLLFAFIAVFALLQYRVLRGSAS